MKKILLFFILVYFFSGETHSQSRINKGKLLPESLVFVQKTYNWNSEKFLVISFRQSRSKCHYDNYKSLRNSAIIRKGFINMRDKTNEFDTKIISVSSDKDKVEKYIDNETIFFDLYDFLGFRFFSKSKSCFCLIVINRDGEFKSKVGEYSADDINLFLTELSN